RRRHTIFSRDWSSDVCSSDLAPPVLRETLVVDKRLPGGSVVVRAAALLDQDKVHDTYFAVNKRRSLHRPPQQPSCVLVCCGLHRSEERRVGTELRWRPVTGP